MYKPHTTPKIKHNSHGPLLGSGAIAIRVEAIPTRFLVLITKKLLVSTVFISTRKLVAFVFTREELLEELDREEQPAERTYSGLTEFRVSRVTASSAPRAARRGPRDVASSATRRGSSTKEVTRRKMWRRQATAGCAHEICEVGHSTENSE